VPWRGPDYEGEVPSLGPQIAATWYELFPSPRDESAPFELTEDQFTTLCRWYALDPETGQFVRHRGYSRRAKGTGKSPIEAAKCISELALPVKFDGWSADGEPVARPWGTGGLPAPLVQIAALSEDQTENVATPLSVFLIANDGRLADALHLDPGATRVLHRGMAGAKIEAVTSRAGSREGQPLVYATLDETSLLNAQNGGVRLAAVLHRNAAKMGGRVFECTNGFVPGEGSVAESTEKAAKAGASIFADVIEAPREVRGVKITEEAPDEFLTDALRVAFADSWWVDLERIVKSIRDGDRPWGDAERWWLNWCAKTESAAVDPARWAELADRARTVEPGEYIGMGFDGSISGDATALYGCTRDGFSFELGVWERPLDGEGHPVKRWRVPRREVHAKVAEAFENYRVGRMLVDPPKWLSELEGWMDTYNDDDDDEPVVIALETNQPRRMGPAIDRWCTAIAEGTHTHDGSDALTRHVEAARLGTARVRGDQDDPRTLLALTKGEDGRKIDAAVADVLAFEAAMTMPEEPVEEPLEPFFHVSIH
jgi:hypothetical protein